MTNPIAKAVAKVAVNMGYGKASDYKGCTIKEVLTTMFIKMGYGKRSDYSGDLTDVLYCAAKIAKDKGGPGGDDSVLAALIDRSITEIKNDNATSIGDGAFAGCSALATVDLPNATSIGDGAFASISSNAVINLGAAENEISGAPWGAPNGVTINYNVR